MAKQLVIEKIEFEKEQERLQKMKEEKERLAEERKLVSSPTEFT